MNRKWAGFALPAFLLAVAIPVSAADPDPHSGRVVFQQSQPDADGFFTLTMSMYDLTFQVYQFALRYDPAAVQPVTAHGETTTSFDQFAVMDPNAQDWISTIGTTLQSDIGLIDFAGYLFPGTQAPQMSDTGEALADSNGLPVYTFYFRALSDEADPQFQIATEPKGDPYNPACPQGVILAGKGGEYSVQVTFEMSDQSHTEDFVMETPAPTVSSSGTPAPTARPSAPPTARPTPTAKPTATAKPVPTATPTPTQKPASTSTPAPDYTAAMQNLLQAAVVLQIDNYAAVVHGGVTAIYPGERSVTAYARDNRTFVPVRFAGERLGATVSWNGDDSTVTLSKNGHSVVMTIGSTTYTVDGETRTLDAPAELQASTDGNFRTMAPLRFLSEGLGDQVFWDRARNLVVIAPKDADWSGNAGEAALKEAARLLDAYSAFV